MRRILLAVLGLAVVVPQAAARGNDLVGGGQAPPGKYPFLVAVIQNGFGSAWQGQYCAGTLISPKRVLTAASCIDQVDDPSEISVVVGQGDLTSGSNRTIAVDAAVEYPGYQSPSQFGDGDIAVLRLRTAVTGVTPATLAPSLPAAGTAVQMAGWGRTNPEGAFPAHLQEATLQIVADTACRDAYQTGFDVHSQVCAGVPGGGVGPCRGDEGGPLLVDAGGTFEIVGVVSDGIGCGLPQFPGLFARVTAPALRAWVLSDPPLPPVEELPPTVSGAPARVGRPLRCHRGSWSSSVPLAYHELWFRISADGAEIGAGASYVPRDADRGFGLGCLVTVTDASGNESLDAAITDPVVRFADELPDTVAPTARTPRLSCPGRTCTITDRVRDRGGSGVARVEIQVVTVGANGGVSLAARDVRARHGRVRLHLSLPAGRHTVFARAVDRAGNRQRRPARLDDGGTGRSVQVINGTLTTTTAFPFVGAMVYNGLPSDVGLHCAGTLIAPTVVLTAAHCVAFTPPGTFDMVFGRSLLSGNDGERIAVTGVSWDPRYDIFALGNDVALAHLAHAPAGVTPAPLIAPATAALAASGSAAAIVGWGATYSDQDGEVYPDQLHRGDMVIQSDAACDTGVGGFYEPATMLCAAAGPAGQTTCHGDSGGPLLVDDAGTWTVAGITSFGLACGSTTSPSVFTKVLGVRSWLDASPPAAPVQWGGVFVTGAVRVGGEVRCVARVAGAGLRFRYEWLSDGAVVRRAATNAWRIPARLAGHALACDAEVSNNGGAILTTASADRRVLVTSHGDGGAPRLRPVRIVCTATLGTGAPRCSAGVRAEDRGSGVAAISLLIDAETPSGGHIVRSWETRRSKASTMLPRLAHGTYRILATAVDRAGNRSAPQLVTQAF